MPIFAHLSLGKLCGKGSKANGKQIKSSKESHSNDPSPSDNIRHSDDPPPSDYGPIQSDTKHSDDPTQSDIKHSDEPTQSEEKHSDDPTQSDKEHSNDATRNGMSPLLNFPLEDMKIVTNNFAKANFIGEGFLGKIYGGQVSLSQKLIDVSVRRLDNSFRLQELAFEKEISILSRLKHPNIVSIVGYCYEDNEMLIVSERVTHGSLRWHLSDKNLTWMKRLEISIGVVSALSYLHNGAGQNISVVHHNINCDSILLDENWEAKISGFEYSMTIPAGVLDLAYEKLGIGTYKSDVFSIGMVLFELLRCREAIMLKDNKGFRASSAIFHYKNRKLHEFVDDYLYSQMDELSLNIFSNTAYDCLNNQRAPPTMNEVLKRLQRALKVQQLHENNEHSTVEVARTIPDHLKLKLESLKHMRIPFDEIVFATENFSKRCIVSSGGYAFVYIAKLKHVDKEHCIAIERENEREVPKILSTVAVKLIIDTEDEIARQGFYAEIEMLTYCKHPNIINLLGFCEEGNKLILIYEYASIGSLSDYLLKPYSTYIDCWAQRLKICLDIANGLSYLHNTKGDRQKILHRDIKSSNILLDENFEAKIGDFGLSMFLPVLTDTRDSKIIVGTPGYMDPQYCEDAKLKIESDIYSFGVVLFEILFGTVAYDTKYDNVGLAIVARQHVENKPIEEILDSKLKEEITKTLFSFIKGPNKESLYTFSEIACKCLAEAQDKRPTMAVIITELKKALRFQENRKDILQISRNDIESATDNFSNEVKYIGEELLWKAYSGEVVHDNGPRTIIDVKRFSSRDKYIYDAELKVLTEYKHENVIGLLGYCEDGEERYIVYEHTFHGRLDQYLNDVGLTWGKRLKICMDIARGLDFLHGGSLTGEVVIHRDIKSNNILLDANMNAKIAHFGFSVMHPADQGMILVDAVLGTRAYLDPDYQKTYLLSKECDIYSFGILLFEILLRRWAYDFDIKKKESYLLGPIIKDLYKQGKLDDMMFEGTHEQIAPQSLTIFKRVAIQCLSDKREERPTAGEVMIQLKQALQIQEKGMDITRISLEGIKYATNNFSEENCIGKGVLGKIYKGQLPNANGQKVIVAKRWDGKYSQGDSIFYQELEILLRFTHKHVIGLEGYCDESGEKIIVYEFASNGSLDQLLNNTSDLTWKKRLEIGIDVANGLHFLHGGTVLRREGVLHRNIKSSNILLSWDWKAKITEFGLSLIRPNNQEIDHEEPVSNIDPTYMETGTISKAADIHSLGVVLFELLCGRSAHSGDADNSHYLSSLAKNYYEQNKLDELVFEGIKEKTAPQSLSIFATIAYQCLHEDEHQRPTASDVLAQLNEALEFQVDYETWKPKLPSDYKELFQQSETPEICDTEKKEVLYNMLLDGILIQKEKVGFCLDRNNNRNEMLSATLFTYKNKSSQKWRRIRKSRFRQVSLMMDISNLKIQAKIKAQFLSPDVVYGVYLVFKFSESNQISSKPIFYVNLKYKWENETLHAYFATWRDNEYLMIELYRFLNNNDYGDFEVLLDSLSRRCCRSGAIYVEGIEFAAINDVTGDVIEKPKDEQQTIRSNLQMGQMQQLPTNYDEEFDSSKNRDEDAELFQQSVRNGNKHYMLSAKEALYNSSNEKVFKVKPSEQSRFGEVIEVQSQQVFGIKCKVEHQILLPNTDYMCYLIFKLSEKCRGLHCPVKVRDLLHSRIKVTKDLYFRYPNIWNIHDINQVPEERKDGWMEVNVWKFNSMDKLKNDCIQVNLKLISYEGTMSGLIVCGLEFRPV